MGRVTADHHAQLTEQLRHQAELITSLTGQVRDLADRLRRLEEVRTPAPTAKPMRVSVRQAGVILGVSRTTVCQYAATGLLMRLPKPKGAGKTVRTFFHPDNVAALAQSEDAAREWVAKRKFVPLAKRSR